MEIVGKVVEIIEKKLKTTYKSIVVVDTEKINGKENFDRLSVEFRKKLHLKAQIFKVNDTIKTRIKNEFKKDNYTNCYNNLVAKSVERI